MPATPAWPPGSVPRLFVDAALAASGTIELAPDQSHYLSRVMRLKSGDALVLFDDRTGDYAARLIDADRRRASVAVEARIRPREETPDLWLCVAPIRRARFDWVAEKACELGVRRFVPVLTARAVVDKVKPDRLRAQMIEAAEQCERTALPQIAPLTPLAELLRDWPEGRALFFADERGGEPLARALAQASGPAAFLIGPEGGFSDAENAAIRAIHSACAVSLGPRILRADTAAVAAVAAWMAACGDW